LRNNTLILVCSDNGHEAGAGSSAPLLGYKTLLYEGGIRSPLIVWGPGLIDKQAAGTTNRQSVFSAIDVNRSLYALTETPLPKGVDFDGENVVDTLMGRTTKGRQAPIFFRRPPDRPSTVTKSDEKVARSDDAPDLAVRDGKWKFLINYDRTDPQLYDLSNDQSEQNNLVDQFPDQSNRLREALFQWNADLPKDAGDPMFGDVQPLADDQFVNPIGEGADPWVMQHPGGDGYLWCMSEGNVGIAIHTSDSATSMGTKHVVWNAPNSGPVSEQVWAPELHFLDGRYHIYFAASDGKNENHLTYVLVSKSDDPLGDYQLHGPLATGEGDGRNDPNIWAIDMTVLQHAGQRYALWSGWDAPGTDRQYLYIAKMKSPTQLVGARVRICGNNELPWEYTENAGKGRGLNEAPQVIQHEGRVFVTYSCGGSWLPTYKLGMLELTGSDPLNPDCWVKTKRPVFRSTDETFGVGHSCVVPGVDGETMWHVYHAKRDRNPGWRRGIHVQPMNFNRNGLPQFGRPIAPGEPQQRDNAPQQVDLSGGTNLLSQPDPWQVFAHHQRYRFTKDSLR
ncbi:MAG: family 43 glycosylhydrolase, partial [Planctomycetota bacterium]